MRTIVVSDLHVGSAKHWDLLRRPELREPLLDKLDGKERKQLRKLLRKASKGLSKAGAETDDADADADLDEADSDA